MRNPNYYNKIVILFIATIANIVLMWFFIIRQESSDWIASRIVHQVSPYAVSADNGRVTVNNVLAGYELKLPPGFKTVGARNFTFYLEEDGEKKCEIRHYYVLDKEKHEIASSEKMIIPAGEIRLVFQLVGPKTERTDCAKYFEQIKRNFIME